MGMLGLGFGLIFTSLTTKYRDLKFLLKFGMQLFMYATPVIYPMSLLEGNYLKAMWFNPMSHVLEAFKYMFLGEGLFSIEGLLYSSSFAIFLLIIGIMVFNKTEKNFVDTV